MMFCIDAPAENTTITDSLEIDGWAFSPESPIRSVVAAVDGAEVGQLTYGSTRDDVYSAYPTPCARMSGFRGQIEFPSLVPGNHILTLCITLHDGSKAIVPRTVVVRPSTANRLHELPAKEHMIQEMLEGFATSDPMNWAQRDRWYSESEPEVSIILLNLNKADLTIRCIKELWKHTTGRPYELIVVDNGSQPDDFVKLMRFQGSVRIIRLNRNRYFVEGNNIGAEAATGKYLFFLNNDAFISHHWLEPIMRVFEDHDRVGAVGPKFVYPDGTLLQAGCLVNVDGTVNSLGRASDQDESAFNVLREVDYCSAAGLMVRKDLFDEVLGFDLCWEPAYYEDVDLCMKIKQLGYRVFYCPDAKIVHLEQFTSLDTSHNINIGSAVEINRHKFVNRWKVNLSDRGTVFERMPTETPAQELGFHIT
jgi:GT2 family glycosyltransferase